LKRTRYKRYTRYICTLHSLHCTLPHYTRTLHSLHFDLGPKIFGLKKIVGHRWPRRAEATSPGQKFLANKIEGGMWSTLHPQHLTLQVDAAYATLCATLEAQPQRLPPKISRGHRRPRADAPCQGPKFSAPKKKSIDCGNDGGPTLTMPWTSTRLRCLRCSLSECSSGAGEVPQQRRSAIKWAAPTRSASA
jgi:hypothetical protein